MRVCTVPMEIDVRVEDLRLINFYRGVDEPFYVVEWTGKDQRLYGAVKARHLAEYVLQEEAQ